MSCGERPLEVLVDHRVAAVLHDDERARELLQPRQRLDEDLRLLVGAQVRAGVEREVASCGVRAVLVDVVVREVVGPDGDHLAARVQVDEHVHLAVRGQVDLGPGPERAARLAHLDAVDR